MCRERMKIPVFHDDQHGTAIIVGAAILNGLRVVGKELGGVKLVCHDGPMFECGGVPFAVSICNCLACQRRTGSAFGMQAGFKADQVQVVGRFNDYSRISDEADRKSTSSISPDWLPGFLHRTHRTHLSSRTSSTVVSAADQSGYDSRRHRGPVERSDHAPELWTWHGLVAADDTTKGGPGLRTDEPAHQAFLYYNVVRDFAGRHRRRRAPGTGHPHAGGFARWRWRPTSIRSATSRPADLI
jgi:hypothetical protein